VLDYLQKTENNPKHLRNMIGKTLYSKRTKENLTNFVKSLSYRPFSGLHLWVAFPETTIRLLLRVFTSSEIIKVPISDLQLSI
jgi:hypothetical protein